MRMLIQYGLLVLVLVLSWRRGEWPERAGAGILIGALIVDQIFLATIRGSIFHTVDLWDLSLDLAMLAGFVILALVADRKWPLWVAALQIIATSAHLLRAIRLDMLEIVYPLIVRTPYYGQIIVLIIALLIGPNLRKNTP